MAIGQFKDLHANDGSLTATKVLKDYDAVWAFKENAYTNSGRADEVVLYHAKQAIPRYVVWYQRGGAAGGRGGGRGGAAAGGMAAMRRQRMKASKSRGK